MSKERKIKLPIFRSKPALDIGMPVVLAIRCLVCVKPKALFQEKLSPGIGVDFFVMTCLLFECKLMDSRLSLQVLLPATYQ